MFSQELRTGFRIPRKQNTGEDQPSSSNSAVEPAQASRSKLSSSRDRIETPLNASRSNAYEQSQNRRSNEPNKQTPRQGIKRSAGGQEMGGQRGGGRGTRGGPAERRSQAWGSRDARHAGGSGRPDKGGVVDDILHRMVPPPNQHTKNRGPRTPSDGDVALSEPDSAKSLPRDDDGHIHVSVPVSAAGGHGSLLTVDLVERHNSYTSMMYAGPGPEPPGPSTSTASAPIPAPVPTSVRFRPDDLMGMLLEQKMRTGKLEAHDTPIKQQKQRKSMASPDRGHQRRPPLQNNKSGNSKFRNEPAPAEHKWFPGVDELGDGEATDSALNRTGPLEFSMDEQHDLESQMAQFELRAASRPPRAVPINLLTSYNLGDKSGSTPGGGGSSIGATRKGPRTPSASPPHMGAARAPAGPKTPPMIPSRPELLSNSSAASCCSDCSEQSAQRRRDESQLSDEEYEGTRHNHDHSHEHELAPEKKRSRRSGSRTGVPDATGSSTVARSSAKSSTDNNQLLEQLAGMAGVDAQRLQSCLNPEMLETLKGVDPAILLATVGTILQTVAASTSTTTGVTKPATRRAASGKSSSAAGQEAVVSSSTQAHNGGAVDEEMDLDSDEEASPGKSTAEQINNENEQAPTVVTSTPDPLSQAPFAMPPMSMSMPLPPIPLLPIPPFMPPPMFMPPVMPPMMPPPFAIRPTLSSEAAADAISSVAAAVSSMRSTAATNSTTNTSTTSTSNLVLPTPPPPPPPPPSSDDMEASSAPPKPPPPPAETAPPAPSSLSSLPHINTSSANMDVGMQQRPMLLSPPKQVNVIETLLQALAIPKPSVHSPQPPPTSSTMGTFNMSRPPPSTAFSLPPPIVPISSAAAGAIALGIRPELCAQQQQQPTRVNSPPITSQDNTGLMHTPTSRPPPVSSHNMSTFGGFGSGSHQQNQDMSRPPPSTSPVLLDRYGNPLPKPAGESWRTKPTQSQGAVIPVSAADVTAPPPVTPNKGFMSETSSSSNNNSNNKNNVFDSAMTSSRPPNSNSGPGLVDNPFTQTPPSSGPTPLFAPRSSQSHMSHPSTMGPAVQRYPTSPFMGQSPMDMPPRGMDGPSMRSQNMDGLPKRSQNMDGPPMRTQNMDGPPMRTQNMDGPPMHPQNMDGPPMRTQNMDGPPMHPQNMDGPPMRPHNMDGPAMRPTNMDGPPMRTQNMDGPPMHPQNMDGPPMRPHNMDGPAMRPTNMDGPDMRPPNMDGPAMRPPNMDGPAMRPPNMDCSPMRPNNMDGSPMRPPFMDGPPMRPPNMDGSPMRHPNMDGPHMRPPNMDGPHMRPPNMDGPPMRPPHMDGPPMRPPFMDGPPMGPRFGMDGPGPNGPHMRPPFMDGSPMRMQHMEGRPMMHPPMNGPMMRPGPNMNMGPRMPDVWQIQSRGMGGGNHW